MTTTRNIRKNQTILYKGEAPTSVYCVSKGLVRASSITDNGDERTIGLFGPGEYFPVGTAFNKTPVALFYYETVVDSDIEVLSQDTFRERISAQGYAATADMANQYVATMLHVNALGQNSAFGRVAHSLQYLSARFGLPLTKGVYTQISIPLTQNDIARLCGLTRETTTIELGRLRSLDIVAVKKKYYLVHSRKLLETIGEEDLVSLNL